MKSKFIPESTTEIKIEISILNIEISSLQRRISSADNYSYEDIEQYVCLLRDKLAYLKRMQVALRLKEQ